jgi:single-strand DNA-binding protein
MVTLTATGTLSRDAEIKTLQDGKKMLVFSIGVNQGYGDKKTTLWIECVKFSEKTAIVEFLKKGTKVLVLGEPTLRHWESNGKSGTTLQLRLNEIELLGSKPKETTTEVATQVEDSEPPF